MARTLGGGKPVSADALKPLVGAHRPDLNSALQAIVTWATSTSMREHIMRASGFPLPDDLPAFLLVNQLIYRGATRPTDVADAIRTGRSNVSKIVRRLEAAGLAERVADPRDDRGVVIVLTDPGREVASQILAAINETNAHAIDGWTPEELAMLELLVVKLARSLDALPGHPLATAAGVNLDEQVLS